MIVIHKLERGGWQVWMMASHAPMLLLLPRQLRALLEKRDFTDAVLERLFPNAFPDDPDAEKEYQNLLREELLERKLECIKNFEVTLDTRQEMKIQDGHVVARIELTDEDLPLWLGFFHDMRIMIGTRLDITDESWEENLDPKDPRVHELALLRELAFIEEQILQALRVVDRLD